MDDYTQGIKNARKLLYQTRCPDKQLGGIVGDHDRPVSGAAGRKEDAAADHGIAEEEERAADRDELPTKRMPGKRADGAGAHQAEDAAIDNEKGKMLPDLLPPTEKEQVGHDREQENSTDQVN